VPEGPSLVILREEAARFEGQIIVHAEGNTTAIDPARLDGVPILSLRTWGKHFIIELPNFALRIHFLLFGSYRIDARKERAPRLALSMEDGGELNFYGCSVKEVDGDIDEVYDWRGDIMSEQWDARRALKKLRAAPGTLACDALLDQHIFAGVGNIIKNEVLFRTRIHPLSTIGALPAPKLRELVREARQYSFDFLAWKKAFVLKQHWLAHTKTICPRCHIRFSKGKLGLTRRRSFYCDNCQKRYIA
jgi:endonuclease VIII